MELQSYLDKYHPDISAEFIRASTPFYYEPGVRYHPIRSGMGCGSGGSSEPFVIKDADYIKDGSMHVNLYNPDKPEHRIILTSDELSSAIKRIDDTIAPVGKSIKNSRRRLYMSVDGIDYDITQMYFRNYDDKKLSCRIWVSRSCDSPVKTNFNIHQPYFELVGTRKSLTMIKIFNWDSISRSQETYKHNVTVREFKQTVFGNPNIKIKCQLFGDK